VMIRPTRCSVFPCPFVGRFDAFVFLHTILLCGAWFCCSNYARNWADYYYTNLYPPTSDGAGFGA
jgi:hypothetical protein